MRQQALHGCTLGIVDRRLRRLGDLDTLRAKSHHNRMGVLSTIRTWAVGVGCLAGLLLLITAAVNGFVFLVKLAIDWRR